MQDDLYKSRQASSRSNVGSFQAKKQDNTTTNQSSRLQSRIKQKEQEKQYHQQEQVQVKEIQQEQKQEIINFDSDSDGEKQNSKQIQKQQVKEAKETNDNDKLDLNKYMKYAEINNEYHEPGMMDEDLDLPKLQKLTIDSTTQKQTIQYQQNQNENEDENLIICLDQREESQDDIDGEMNDEMQQILKDTKKEDEIKRQFEQKQEESDNLHQSQDNQQGESKNLLDDDIFEKQQTPPLEEEESQEQIQQQQQQQQQLQPPTQAKCPYPRPIDVRLEGQVRQFLINPAPKGGMIQCTIKRDRSGMGRFYPKYHMHLSNGFLYLMSAKKVAFNNTSNYIVAQHREDMENPSNNLGKVRSNFMGTEFTLYDSGKNPTKTNNPEQYREQLGAVFYESNLMSQKGPRKMIVLLPKIDEETNERFKFKPAKVEDGLIKEFKEQRTQKMWICVNRPPQWNSKHKAFVLNFYQRVDKPSVKNFQLVVRDGEDNIWLQFGRVADELFNIDFQYPISPLQAFEIALTSFDYKIACE